MRSWASGGGYYDCPDDNLVVKGLAQSRHVEERFFFRLRVAMKQSKYFEVPI